MLEHENTSVQASIYMLALAVGRPNHYLRHFQSMHEKANTLILKYSNNLLTALW